jgi:hypothetical protein
MQEPGSRKQHAALLASGTGTCEIWVWVWDFWGFCFWDVGVWGAQCAGAGRDAPRPANYKRRRKHRLAQGAGGRGSPGQGLWLGAGRWACGAWPQVQVQAERHCSSQLAVCRLP